MTKKLDLKKFEHPNDDYFTVFRGFDQPSDTDSEKTISLAGDWEFTLIHSICDINMMVIG